MYADDIKGRVIKICGITTPQDAEDAIASGATALGLNFYPESSRFVTLGDAQKIAESMPAGILKVGVFVNPSSEDLAAAQNAAGLDVLQIHGDLPEPPLRGRIWRSIAIDQNFKSQMLSDYYEAYLLDSPTRAFGGSGLTFDWSLAAPSKSLKRLIVAGGLDASNVASAIEALRPWGVDACSRLESKPGRKDRLKVQAFVEAARAAFKQLSTPG